MSNVHDASPLVRARSVGLDLAVRLTWLPPLLARLVIGLVFVLTGWGKLHNLDGVTEYFRTLGIPAPEIQAPFAAAMELLCGALVLAGLATRLASIPLIVIMLVAIRTALWGDITAAEGVLDTLNVLFGLSEFLYVALLAWLAVAGAGVVSFDRLLFRRTK